MKYIIAIAAILLYHQAVRSKNESVTLPPPPPNNTLVETENTLSCFAMQECIKACLSNTPDIQEDDEEDILPMDNVTNTTVSECGKGIWLRIAHLNMTNPTETCPSAWNQYTTPV